MAEAKKTPKTKPAPKRARTGSKTTGEPTSKGPPKESAPDAFKPGQKVSWASSQGTIHGTVKRKLTAPMKIKRHTVNASPENPEYLVESSKTGALASHKAEALKPE